MFEAPTARLVLSFDRPPFHDRVTILCIQLLERLGQSERDLNTVVVNFEDSSLADQAFPSASTTRG
jgi:hypothetical protein